MNLNHLPLLLAASSNRINQPIRTSTTTSETNRCCPFHMENLHHEQTNLRKGYTLKRATLSPRRPTIEVTELEVSTTEATEVTTL